MSALAQPGTLSNATGVRVKSAGAGVTGPGVMGGRVTTGPGRVPPPTMGAGRDEAQAASVTTSDADRMARPIIRVSETKRVGVPTQAMRVG